MRIPKEIRSKYHNKISFCLLKHRHDSRAEAAYCNSLLADRQAGRIGGFEVQVPFDLGAEIKHIVDFVVSSSTVEVHDVKGFQTAVWKIKHKLFVEKYPGIKYVVVNRGKL